MEYKHLTEATDEHPLERMGDTWKLLRGTKWPGLQTCTWSGSTELIGQGYKNSMLPSTPCGTTAGYGEANPVFMPLHPNFLLKTMSQHQNTFENLPEEKEWLSSAYISPTVTNNYICMLW